MRGRVQTSRMGPTLAWTMTWTMLATLATVSCARRSSEPVAAPARATSPSADTASGEPPKTASSASSTPSTSLVALGCQSTPQATEGVACGNDAVCTFDEPALASVRCVCAEQNASYNAGPAPSFSRKAFRCGPKARPDGCPNTLELGTSCASLERRCEYRSSCDGHENREEITCKAHVWVLTRANPVPCRPRQ